MAYLRKTRIAHVIVKVWAKKIWAQQRELCTSWAEKQLTQKAKGIISISDRVLSSKLTVMPSGWCYNLHIRRGNRWLTVKFFIPSALRQLNTEVSFEVNCWGSLILYIYVYLYLHLKWLLHLLNSVIYMNCNKCFILFIHWSLVFPGIYVTCVSDILLPHLWVFLVFECFRYCMDWVKLHMNCVLRTSKVFWTELNL